MREIDNDSHLTVVEVDERCSPSEHQESPSIPPSPISGHALTKADQSRGGKTRAARLRREREEARKSVAQRIAERIEAEQERIMAPYFAAIDNGDWRAAEALLDRHLGKAVQRQEIEDVTDRELAGDGDLERLRALDEEIKRRKAA